jgi:hypothetical protein
MQKEVLLGAGEQRNRQAQENRGIALLVTGFIAIASLVLILVLLWKFRRNSFASKKFEVQGPLVVYSYAQIKKATRNFSDKIGEGGFGTVFRGTIMPGSAAVITVKSLKVLGQQERQFRTEVQRHRRAPTCGRRHGCRGGISPVNRDPESRSGAVLGFGGGAKARNARGRRAPRSGRRRRRRRGALGGDSAGLRATAAGLRATARGSGR